MTTEPYQISVNCRVDNVLFATEPKSSTAVLCPINTRLTFNVNIKKMKDYMQRSVGSIVSVYFDFHLLQVHSTKKRTYIFESFTNKQDEAFKNS